MSSLFEQNPGLVKSLLSDSGYDTGILDGLYAGYVDAGYTGSLEDMAYDALGDIGYTGSLSDRWAAALADGVLGVILVNYALGSSSSNVVSPLISTTRTSSATITQTDGTLTTVPANTPAIDGLTLATTDAEGAQQGDDLAVNGDFSSTTNWIFGGGGTIDTVNKLGVITATSVGYISNNGSETVAVGDEIYITAVVDSISGGGLKLQGGAWASGSGTGASPEISAPGTYTYLVTVESAAFNGCQIVVSSGSVTANISHFEWHKVVPTYLDTNNTVSSSLNTKYGKSKTYVEDVGLHVEGSATNLVADPRDQTAASWVFNGGTRTRNLTAPNGAVEGTTYQGPATGPSYQGGVVANDTTITYSIWARWVSGTTENRIFLLRNDTTATSFDWCTFNVKTGTIVSGVGWSVIDSTNGWYRLSYTRSTGISVGDSLVLYAGSTGVVTDSDGWGLWHVQMESGGYASSETTATRAASTNLLTDTTGATLTPADIGWTSDEIFGEITVTPDVIEDNYNNLLSSPADGQNSFQISHNLVIDGSAAQIARHVGNVWLPSPVSSITLTAGNTFTVRFWHRSDYGAGISVNGELWVTDTTSASKVPVVLGSHIEVGGLNSGQLSVTGHYKLGSEIGMTKAQAEKRWGDLPWQ